MTGSGPPRRAAARRPATAARRPSQPVVSGPPRPRVQ